MSELESVLEAHKTWYHRLDGEQQTLFVKRVTRFVKARRFIGHSVKVSDELKILIASTAVQISFGLKKYLLPHFETIILYPDEYLSRITGRYHLGEVNLGGAIVLSVEDFLKGLADPNDGFNIGIHEFAHAMYFENFIRNQDYLFIDRQEFDGWHRDAGSYMAGIRSGEGDLIRPYAATNVQEFFAVTTEHFFEQPTIFQAQLPALYRRMRTLLNQDPAGGL